MQNWHFVVIAIIASGLLTGCASWTGEAYNSGKEKYQDYREEGIKLIGRYEALKGVYLEIKGTYLEQRKRVKSKCQRDELPDDVCSKLDDFNETVKKLDGQLVQFNKQAQRVIELSKDFDSKVKKIDALKQQAEETYQEAVGTARDLAKIGTAIAGVL